MDKKELIRNIEHLRNRLIESQKESLKCTERWPSSSEEYKGRANGFHYAIFMLELYFEDVLKETPLLDEHEERMKKEAEEKQGRVL